jgi:hypothetical protein
VPQCGAALTRVSKVATPGAGTRKKKAGAKKKDSGKQRVADTGRACEARKRPRGTLKAERSELLTASSSRMVLIVTMNVVNDRGIIIEKGEA